MRRTVTARSLPLRALRSLVPSRMSRLVPSRSASLPLRVLLSLAQWHTGRTMSSRAASLSLCALLSLAAAIAPVVARANVGAAPGATSTETPEALRDIAITQKLGASLPLDLRFQDETGAEVTLGSYFKTRPVVLALVYYECPMLCTLVLNGLVKAMRALALDAGRDYDVVTVSFDPRDTAALAREKKQRYLEVYRREGAETGWHFLTGDAPSIERLTEAVGFAYRYVPEQGQFAHAAAVMIVTPDGRMAKYLYGVEYSARDLRLALVEAAGGKIGTFVDQLLLYCFQYDPALGRYSAVAITAVRAGGVLTVGGFLAFVAVMLRRERRRATPAAKARP